MRVGISLLTLVPGEMGGSETAVRGLTRGLAAVGAHDYTVVVPANAAGAGEGLPESVVAGWRTSPSAAGRALSLARARLARRRLRPHYAVDVVHYALTVAVPRVEAPTVVTLYDLQHLDLPELFTRGERLYRRRFYEGSARRADAVVVTSEFVRRSVVEHLDLPPDRVHAIPLGIDHARFGPGEETREPFLLYPARPWPHKNHARLFDAFALLRRDHPELELVLTGGGHEGRPVPEGVTVLGLVSADELASLYRRASCLVFPSLYEGFGQPPLEAMACGCPVAASSAGALPEACGDAAAVFDPTAPEDIAAAVGRVLANPEPYVVAGLAQAARFSWTETARRHDAVYAALPRRPRR